MPVALQVLDALLKGIGTYARRYMSPACSFLVSGSMGSGALSGATLGRSRETRRDPTTAIAMNFCAQASSSKNLDDGTQG